MQKLSTVLVIHTYYICIKMSVLVSVFMCILEISQSSSQLNVFKINVHKKWTVFSVCLPQTSMRKCELYLLLLDSTVFMNSIPFFITEIARQAAQIKLLRKLQKQEQARAAKEAKKQQGKYQTCENLCVLEDQFENC